MPSFNQLLVFNLLRRVAHAPSCDVCDQRALFIAATNLDMLNTACLCHTVGELTVLQEEV